MTPVFWNHLQGANVSTPGSGGVVAMLLNHRLFSGKLSASDTPAFRRFDFDMCSQVGRPVLADPKNEMVRQDCPTYQAHHFDAFIFAIHTPAF